MINRDSTHRQDSHLGDKSLEVSISDKWPSVFDCRKQPVALANRASTPRAPSAAGEALAREMSAGTPQPSSEIMHISISDLIFSAPP